MSLLGRTASRFMPVILEGLCKSNVSRIPVIKSQIVTKSFSSISTTSSILKTSRTSSLCSCCSNGLHTKGDQELVSFLEDEIKEEKKSMIAKVPTSVGEFTVKHNQSQIIFTRQFKDEQITISMDVNHSVDAETSEVEPTEDGQGAELKSKPSFEVDIKRGNQVMSFTCSFLSNEGEQPQDASAQDVVEDVFGINELTIYEGEWNDDVYCVSGDILDETLYDLLLTYLEERGINEEFAESLSNICGDYEHSLYVGLLEKVQGFIGKK